MKIRIEDSKLGVCEQEVPADFFTLAKLEETPSIEERLTALEEENTTLKTQLAELAPLVEAMKTDSKG